MLELCHGAPAEKRAENEQAVYDFLDRHGIPFTRVDHPAVHTMEECVESADVLQVDMCKNLFLCNSQKTKFYLLMINKCCTLILTIFLCQFNRHLLIKCCTLR